MTATRARLDAIAAQTAAGFDAADRRYRDRTATVRPARREQPAVRRLRARLIADADAADGVVPQLLLPAGLDMARPGVRRT